MADVLLLDDNHELLEMFKVLFRHKGLGLRAVEDESSFVNEITKQKPDLIILDIFLSDSDGRKICKNLKSKDDFKDVPVILMSANAKLLESCKGVCGDEYLEKPFYLKELFDKVQRYLKK